MAACQIQLRQVGKRFGDLHILKDIDLAVRPGEFCVCIGPSGCGKSTLLRLIAGLDDVSEGEIEIDGVVVNALPPAQRQVAMVFQGYALYPHMTVFENMAFGLRHRKLGGADIERRVAEAARILHLEDLLQRKPRALSGGQRQRVAIGRAIVRQPKVFLFDEPLSNLDAALRVQTRLEIARLHRELGSAGMVYVTHDQVEAMTLASQIVLLRPDPGRQGLPSIAQAGPPLALYHHPANQFVAGFIGSPAMNFLPGQVTWVDGQGVQVQVRGGVCAARVEARGLHPGSPVTLGIRPEHVQVGMGPLSARVAHLEHLGEHSHVVLEIDAAAPVLMAKTRRSDIRLGDRVPVTLPAGDAHVFREDGTAQPRLPAMEAGA
jgi:multiple sugar transport system ATP-binding protein